MINLKGKGSQNELSGDLQASNAPGLHSKNQLCKLNTIFPLPEYRNEDFFYNIIMPQIEGHDL